MLWNIIRVTNADYVMYGFLVVLGTAALLLPRFEPGIPTFGEALWYLYAAFTTIGFGDYVASGPTGRIITVVVTLYGILVVALMTGIIVGFYTDLLKARATNALDDFVTELEHLPDLAERIRNRRIFPDP
ncbi:potassium channel family protein [Arthrobacter yangruifuii]|uniref:potassium channel family protein n=1 Tax=Arthrobacter yangruifuii TaxID=2606616 RepID=UPI001FEEB11F|nr:potassium channel family protein [Arthrobacter yangruifuii]